MKILLLDNYDSFTYNLKSLLETSVENAEVKVRRNRDKKIFNENFDMLVISPGPMTWKETGILQELFEKIVIPKKIPVLGICLGMQFIAGFYGYEVGMIKNPVHGSQSEIEHIGDPMFNKIPENFLVARYNSLGIISLGNVDVNDEPLELTAFEKNSGAIMALRHKTLPFTGFQFHPESFLTEFGTQLIKNFMGSYFEDK